MYVESHSTLKHVQTKDPKDHTLRQKEFSISVDEDDFSTRYGEMDDEHFHYMMEAQDRKFYSTFSDPVFNFNDLCDSQVYEKCDLAVFSSGSNEDLGKERIQSTSKLPVWKEVFVGKCGECQVQHEHPRCDQCKKPRQKSGPCSECHYIKKKEDPYQGYCGNCFQIHEFPNCVQCQHYRIKPGRCTNCGAVGPDNTEWIYTCLGQDEEFKEIMKPILEARKIKVTEENKKFTTYKNCPLCRGYFHSAKACIFRTHVKHFNLLQKKMDQFSEEINTTTRMVIPIPDSDTDSEEEEEYSEESEDEDCGTYMMIVHHGNSSEEESMDEDEEAKLSFSKLKSVTMYDKILTIVARQKKEEQQDGQTEDPEEHDS